MDISLSNIVSASDIQKNYRKIFNRVKKTKKAVVVMRGNKPEVAVMDMKTLNELQKKIEEIEWAQALEAIGIAEEEAGSGKLKILKPGELTKLAK